MGCYKQINKKKKIPGESGERKVVGARRRRRRGGGGKKKRVEPKRGRGSEKGCVRHC